MTAIRNLAIMAGTLTLLAGCANQLPGGLSETSTPAADPSTSSPPSPDSSTAIYGIRLDVLENHTLRTIEGKTFQLPENITYVIRVHAGWLIGRSDGNTDQPVALLTPDGAAKQLQATVHQGTFEMPGIPVVSADGTRLAWYQGSTVYAGQLTAQGLSDVKSSPAPDGTYPLTWYGNRVVLGKSYGDACCGYRQADYDVWDPAAGAFVAHWTRGLSPVYGPAPASAPLFGARATDTGMAACLARLDGVKDLSTTTSTCLPGQYSGSLMWALSPDGKHLVDLVSEKLQVFDLTTVAQTNKALLDCPGHQPLAWEDNTSLLTQDSSTGAITRCTIGGTGTGPVTGKAFDQTTRLVPWFAQR